MVNVALKLGGLGYLNLVELGVFLGYVGSVYYKRGSAARDKYVLADVELGKRLAGNRTLVI